MAASAASLNFEITTLIKLLALRGGGAIPIAVDKDPEALYHDDDDDTASVDTTRHGLLAESGDSSLRKRFLNRLSEVLSAQKAGKFVTAAMMREDEREHRVNVWVARNCGFTKSHDKQMFRVMEKSLNEMANGRGYSTSMTDRL